MFTAHRLIVLALLLWPLAAKAYGPNGNEDRCEELGASCICSEPLNFNLNLAVAGTYVSSGGIVDPPDTLHAGDKECGPTSGSTEGFVLMPSPGWPTALDHMQLASAEMTFPNGYTGYVLQGDWGGTGHALLMPGRTITLNENETLCYRVYNRFRVGTVWPPDECTTQLINGVVTPQGGRIKSLILGSDTPNFWKTIFEWIGYLDSANPPSGPGNFPVIQRNYQMDNISEPHSNGGDNDFNVTLGKCSDNWCRMEVCLDRTGSTIKARWRTTEIKASGNIEHSTSFGPNTSSVGSGALTITSGYDLRGSQLSMFIQCSEENIWSWGIANPKYYASHAIVTKTAYDLSHWPGPAYELEGGAIVPPAVNYNSGRTTN